MVSGENALPPPTTTTTKTISLPYHAQPAAFPGKLSDVPEGAPQCQPPPLPLTPAELLLTNAAGRRETFAQNKKRAHRLPFCFYCSMKCLSFPDVFLTFPDVLGFCLVSLF